MKIVVAGGTGWLGNAICGSLARDSYDVVVLSRSGVPRVPAGARSVIWDGRTLGDWANEIEGADAVVNLAGAPIAPRRWTARRKRLLRSSRLDATRTLVTAIANASPRPTVLINTSAVGFYGDSADEIVAESDPAGAGFLAGLVAEWEAAALPAAEVGIRVVLPRVGVVLGRGGGALRYLSLPFRAFLGGPIGCGRQWVSWVHIEDVVGAYRFALEHDVVRGPLNVTAPRPVQNRELARSLGQALSRPNWAPVPSWAMRLALGELASTLLTGQRAPPMALQNLGYVFHQPDLLPALRQALC